MAAQTQKASPPPPLPQVLVLKTPPAVALFGGDFYSSPKYQLLNAYHSDLPLPEFLSRHASSVRAILSSAGAPVTAETISSLPELRFIVTTSQGLDHINLPECRRRGIAVASAGTIFSADCADAVVGLLIAVLRKISAADRYVRQGLWPCEGDYSLGSKLRGKRIGIVGLGSIGTAVAKRLEPFGCLIAYNSRTKKPSCSYPFYSHIRDLASDSDVLVICCALTEETRHLISRDVLLALGRDGVVINIGRGAIVDEKELVRCLVEGEIKGAGLDVFEREPDVPEELFLLDNVVMSPHNAVCTMESFEELRALVIGNLQAFFSDQPLLTPVNLDH